MFKSTGSEKATGWDYHEPRRGHDVMITAPEELSKLLIDILEKK